MSTKLHAVTDANGRPHSFLTARQISDDAELRLCWTICPKQLLGNSCHNADWFREALQAKGIKTCIPGQKFQLQPVK